MLNFKNWPKLRVLRRNDKFLALIILTVLLYGFLFQPPLQSRASGVSNNSGSSKIVGSAPPQELPRTHQYKPTTLTFRGGSISKNTVASLKSEMYSALGGLSSSSLPNYSPVDQTTADPSGTPVINHAPITINVILAGVPISLASETQLISYLPSTYTQIDRLKGLITNQTLVYTEYDITYNFQSAPSSFINGYVNFLNTNLVPGPVPKWLQPYATEVHLVSASSAENYVWTNLASTYTGYTAVLLNFTVSAGYYYFYNGSVPDPDFHVDRLPTSSNYMVAYGGAHRMLFVDFSAGPADYCGTAICPQYIGLNKSFIGSPIVPIWEFDLTNATQYQFAQIQFGWAIREAVESRFIPSFLYQPSYYPNYLVNITIYSFDPSITWSSYINPSLVKSDFGLLLPLSTIGISVNEYPSPQTSDPEFYSAFQASFNATSSQYTVGSYSQPGSIVYYVVNHIQKYATDYIQNNQYYHVVPVVVVAGQDQLDYYGGSAENNAAGDHAFTFDGYGHSQLQNWVGLTYLNIHESGHGFGLAHPHDFYDYQYGDLGGLQGLGGFIHSGSTFIPIGELWLWDFSSDPMTYAATNNPYDSMAIDNLAQGQTAYLLNQTTFLESLASEAYVSLGYGIVPPKVTSDLTAAESSYNSAVASFEVANPNYAVAASDAHDAESRAFAALVDMYTNLLSISYVVTDHEGNQIAGAQIQATLPNGTKISGVADANGKLTFSNLPWGNYSYTVKYEGSVVGGTQQTEEASTQRTLLVNTYSLSLSKLVTTDGDLLDAPIKITSPNGTTSTVQPGFSQKVAENGTWSLSVTYEGIAVYSKSFELSSSVVLSPTVNASRLAFNIVDSSGNALQGASFSVRSANGSTIALVANSSGLSSLGIVPDGQYQITSIIFEGVNVVPSSGNTVQLSKGQEFEIRSLVAGLAFQILDNSSRPLNAANAVVVLANGTSTSFESNSSGYISIAQAPEGSYSMSSLTWQGVGVLPSQPASVQLTGTTVITVNARVYDLRIDVKDALGISVSGATVTLTYPNGTSISLTSGSDGSVVFKDLPQGSYNGKASLFGALSSFTVGSSQLDSGSASATTPLSSAVFGIIGGVIVVAAVVVVIVVMRRKKP